MKSWRVRMALWFGVSFLALTGAFLFFSHRLLEQELRNKNWQKDYPTHPDWKLHGSYSEAEVRDITGELTETTLICVAPLAIVAAALGFWLARKSLRPIASVNQQLQAKTSANLGEPIALSEVDAEFRDLLRHLNDLLARLDASFAEMNDYAAKVAHELRTPLAILRLKVEQAGAKIPPELSDELESELHRLTHVVDQSLLVARADQGRVTVQPVACNLAAVVAEIVEDFRLLAVEDGRRLILEAPETCWITADNRHLRQVIHNLLTNAFKHGRGDLLVRVKASAARPSLMIANPLGHPNGNAHPTSGLGLRVVAALLRLEPEIHLQRRRSNKYYLVRVSFPASGAAQPSYECKVV